MHGGVDYFDPAVFVGTNLTSALGIPMTTSVDAPADDCMPLRVFLCYAGEDRDFARQVADFLETENADIRVIWDQQFCPGREFGELIRTGIAHSHLFLPIITVVSHAKGWIHQEIGYAISMNIPIVPISIGQIPPQEMIASLQAVMLADETDDAWKVRLRRETLNSLLGFYSDESLARYR